MFDETAFPFLTTKEAWDYFTKAARVHFARLIRQESEDNPEIRKEIKFLSHKDYCARLMYVINMFAYEGNPDGEFDLDWAMLMSRPLSAKQARASVRDLIELGLMGERKTDEQRPNEQRLLGTGRDDSESTGGGGVPPASKRPHPTKGGGDTGPTTKFNFD